jgi:NAD(P)-dependent dehydrogenase (short-subunit alcohol dehydrogenase family)
MIAVGVGSRLTPVWQGSVAGRGVKGEIAMELEGQAAIVTGAGRGIGRSIALELASLGSNIVVADVLDENAEQVAEEIHALGREAVPLHVDVTSRTDLDVMAEKAMAEFGRIDVLVNNAGVNWFGSVLDVTEESWDFVMDVNAKGVFFSSQAVLPHMFAAKRGSIVSLASMAGKLGSTYSAAYAASKAAVISITRSLALSGAPYGVRANCVCPGYIHSTDMWRQVEVGISSVLGTTPEELNAQRLKQIPLGRWESPEDVAKLIGFLASDRSWYITGEDVNVSGGLVMH